MIKEISYRVTHMDWDNRVRIAWMRRLKGIRVLGVRHGPMKSYQSPLTFDWVRHKGRVVRLQVQEFEE